ncbi:MAG TPA: hypothetical protein VLA04_00370 [Verrucomicrobiae bacterium]|nr:hypothetical protein [Verrucomicrobiae bacterium]
MQTQERLGAILDLHEYDPVLGISISTCHTLDTLAATAARAQDVAAVTYLCIGALCPLDSAHPKVASKDSCADELLRQHLANQIGLKETELSEILAHRLGTPATYTVLGAILFTCAGFSPKIAIMWDGPTPNYPFLVVNDQVIDLHGLALGNAADYLQQDAFIPFNQG